MAKQKQKPQVAAKEPQPVSKPRISTSHIVACIVVFLAACIVYANTLGHGFVLDDPLAIGLNKNVTKGFGGISNLLGGAYRENSLGGQLYRPVALVQFAFEWGLSPDNPFIHHLFNVLWYGLVCVLVYLVIDRWFDGSKKLLAFSVALIFAVHPIHTEVVANIKSRDEIMSLFFVLLSFWLFSSYLKQKKTINLMLALGSYFLALVSKEGAVTMLPVFGMSAWWIHKSDTGASLRKGLLFVVPVILMFIIRWAVFGDAAAPAIDVMDNPLVGASGWGERFGTSMSVLLKYFTLMILPHPLSCDYSYLVLPLTGITGLKSIIGLVLHIALLAIAIVGKNKRSFLSLSVFGYLFSIFLYSQLPMVIGTLFGERLAFLPSFWFISGLLYWIFSLTDSSNQKNDTLISAISSQKLYSAGVLIVSMVLAYLTFTRNTAWHDNYTLFKTDVKTYPTSIRLNNGVAEELIKAANPNLKSAEECNNLLAQAEQHCQYILKTKPVATAYLSLGNIRFMQKRYEEAIAYYDQVNDLKSIVDTGKALSYRELGRQAGEKENDLTKSRDLLSKSLGLNNQDSETWFLMGVSYGVGGDHQKAAEYFEKAYSIKPDNNIAKNAATAYRNAGNAEKAAKFEGLSNQ